LYLDGIVASVEDEQGSGSLLFVLLSREVQKRFHLLGGNLVGVLPRAHALYVHGSGPALANEIELCDELVGPPCYDRLPGGVAGRVMVVPTLGATFCVAAIPHAHVHGVHRSLGLREWVMSEQSSYGLGIDSSTAERVVEAAPATAVRRL
jgi:hypothetical protein